MRAPVESIRVERAGMEDLPGTSGCGVLKVEGGFSPAAMVDFRNRLAELVDGGCVRVVLDLDELAWISERGLGLILESSSWLRRLGGKLKLAAGASRVGARLEDFGVDRWVERYGSVSEALESPWPVKGLASEVLANGGGGHVS